MFINFTLLKLSNVPIVLSLGGNYMKYTVIYICTQNFSILLYKVLDFDIPHPLSPLIGGGKVFTL